MNNLLQGRITSWPDALLATLGMILVGFGGTMAIMWIWGAV